MHEHSEAVGSVLREQPRITGSRPPADDELPDDDFTDERTLTHEDDVVAADEPAVAEQLSALTAQIAGLAAAQDVVLGTIKELGVQDRVLGEMHDQTRRLREGFHEREVLHPIFRSLIGIADRCRQENAKLRGAIAAHALHRDVDHALVVQHLVNARKADVIELEALLTRFGVESFESTGQQFHAQWQRCVKRIPTSRQQRVGKIAERLLKGYRRGDAVIRREHVTVYVHAKKEPAQ